MIRGIGRKKGGVKGNPPPVLTLNSSWLIYILSGVRDTRSKIDIVNINKQGFALTFEYTHSNLIYIPYIKILTSSDE